MTANPIYKRVLLKASGEALMGSQGFGIDVAVADRIAADIAEARALGVEVGVVVGGGNIFRGVAVASKGGDRVTGAHVQAPAKGACVPTNLGDSNTRFPHSCASLIP